MNIQDWLEDRIILKVYGGSHSYGTNTPTSDVDVRGGMYSSKKLYYRN